MVTTFQKKVYQALQLIPKGKVTTYKILAEYTGCRSSQAVGQALTRNQNAPTIPCHRVIKSNGTLGGYAFWSEKKQKILESEWVFFDVNNYLIEDKKKIWDFIYNI